MSIQSEITRLSGNVSDAFTAIEAKGVTVPSGSTSDDLYDLIMQITGGGTGAIVIDDTTDSGGGVVRTITAVDISDTTATASDVINSKWFYTADGTKTQGTGTAGSNDFIVTLSYNGTSQMWEPDKTYAEIVAAGSDGKKIAATTNRPTASTSGIVKNGNNLLYVVSSQGSGMLGTSAYSLDSTDTITNLGNILSYVTTSADATSADVLSGKIFYNANGQQTGSLQNMTLPSSASATSSGTSKATITPTSSAQYLNIPTGYNDTAQYYTIAASGGITPTGNINITQAGTTDVTNFATATVPYADATGSCYGNYVTVGGTLKFVVTGESYAETGGWVNGDSIIGSSATREYDVVPQNTTITPTTSAQTVGGDNYMMQGAVTVAAMPTGTAGTPTATKGTVSNHQITVTPSVTNTAGYISGGTVNGTAVTVTAAELVSGSTTINQNGTTDVTNLASVTVAIPIVTYYTGSSAPSSSLGSDGDIYLQTGA